MFQWVKRKLLIRRINRFSNDLPDGSFHSQFDEEAKQESVKRRGSDAIIYGIEYHTIFGDVVRTDRYSKYRKAPTLTLVSLNIEICLKGITMVRTGEEPWMQWKKSKQKHNLKRLYHTMPEKYIKMGYEMFEKNGYERKMTDSKMEQVADSFMKFRYNYETEDDSEISEDKEHFLKVFWDIAYELCMQAQTEHRDNDV